MEISNKTVAILGVLVVALVVAVRNSPDKPQATATSDTVTVASNSEQKSQPQAVVRHRPIPNSALPADTTNFVPKGEDGALLESPLEASPPSTPRTEEHPPSTPSETPADPQSTDVTPDSGTSIDIPQPTDVTVNLRGRYPSGLPGDLSDQEVFDRMMGLVEPEDRTALAGMWLTMSDDERREMLDSMRIAYGGY